MGGDGLSRDTKPVARALALPVVIGGIKTRKDRSINLSIDTAYEMRAEEASRLFDLHLTQAWMVLSPNDDITEEDIPEVKADAETGSKSPGQRLRAVLYVYWKQRGKPGSWENFYLSQMDKLIELVKDKLEPDDGS
jgi:hypothetical protein